MKKERKRPETPINRGNYGHQRKKKKKGDKSLSVSYKAQ